MAKKKSFRARNQPCSCGSGLKTKLCSCRNLRQIPPEVVKELERQAQWRTDYGHVKETIHENFAGRKWVAVGNRLVHGNFVTFHDFLLEYIKLTLGVDWMNSELQKPHAERHVILQWFEEFENFRANITNGKKGIFRAQPTGIVAAYLSLAYDLYLIEHNTELRDALLLRLKDSDKFQGARYELMTAACCAMAGFTLEYENEADGSTTHVEFTAYHPVFRDRIAVEAKSKHRKDVLGFNDPTAKPLTDLARVGVTDLINAARKKHTAHPLVIFVDLNVPVTIDQENKLPWAEKIRKNCDSIIKSFGDNAVPFNMIVFMNRSFHYRPGDPAVSDPPGFVFVGNPVNKLQYAEQTLGILKEAVEKYGKIPMEFPDNSGAIEVR